MADLGSTTSMDPLLHQALMAVRRTAETEADMELRENCLRQEWEAASLEERELLYELVQDGVFWSEVTTKTQDEMAQASDEIWDEKRFRKMFRDFDEDGSGSIEIAELRALLKNALRLDCSDDEVRSIMSTIDKDGNSGIDEDEFIEIMNAARRQQDESGKASPSSPPRADGSTPARGRSPMEGTLAVGTAPPTRSEVRRQSIEQHKQDLQQKAAESRRLSQSWTGE